MKTLKKELRPDWDFAQQVYPLVLKRLKEYETFHDSQAEGTPEAVFEEEYKKMERYLSDLVGKDLSQIWLWEWWEIDGIEAFAFQLAMPKPKKYSNLTKNDLMAFVKILKDNEFECENDFQDEFMLYMFDNESYFYQFLEINFKGFNYDYFLRQKDKNGKYYELSADEIVEKIWENC